MKEKLEKFIINRWLKMPLWKLFISNLLFMSTVGFLVQSIGGIDFTDVIFNIIISLFYAGAMVFFSWGERLREENIKNQKCETNNQK